MGESQIVHTPDSSGKGVRTIEVTTVISGVPTLVEMQVIAIADENGNIIRNFADYNLQVALLTELRAIRTILARANNIFDPISEGPAISSVQQ